MSWVGTLGVVSRRILFGETTSKLTEMYRGYDSSLSINIRVVSWFFSKLRHWISVVWVCFACRWSFNDAMVILESETEILYEAKTFVWTDFGWLVAYRNKNWRFVCILSKRSYSGRWCRFMLNVLASVIRIKSRPKLKPVHRHFWNPCSSSIRPHRKQVSKKTFLSLSCGLKHHCNQ